MFEQIETNDSVFLRLEDKDKITFIQLTNDIPVAYTTDGVEFRGRSYNHHVGLTTEEMETLKKLLSDRTWPVASDTISVVLIEDDSDSDAMELLRKVSCVLCGGEDSAVVPLRIFSYYPVDVEAVIFHHKPVKHMMIPTNRHKPHIDICFKQGLVLTIFCHALGYKEEHQVLNLIDELLNVEEAHLQQITLV